MDHQTFHCLIDGSHRRLLAEIRAALEMHARWLARIDLCLWCGDEPEPDDLAEDAHQRSELGVWYFALANQGMMTELDEFIQLGRLHIEVHAFARRLLQRRAEGESVDEKGYPYLHALAEGLRKALRDLESRIEGEVYAFTDLLLNHFAKTQEGAILLSSDLHIELVNEAFTRITGYTEREVAGSRPDVLYAEPQGEEFYEALWLGVKQRGIWQGEIWNRRKNGETYLQRLEVFCIRSGDASHYLAMIADVTTERENREQLRRIAHYDPITGLPNRMLFQDRLNREIAYARRLHGTLGILFIDLDDFKRINDAHGHETGDMLLARVAERLRNLLRSSDSIGRYGGDEFVILTQLKEPEDVDVVAAKVMAALRQPFDLEGRSVAVTASMGVSLFPAHAADGEVLLRYADLAMYHAKNSGKNHYRLYFPVALN